MVLDLAPATKPTSTQKAEIPRPIQKTSGMSAARLSDRADPGNERRPNGRRPRRDRFCAVKLLAFSDLHRDLDQAARLVEMSAEADLVIGAGDFASVHEGLEETIAALAAIETPTVLVPGNNETEDALREAATGWSAATVLHGDGTTIDGVEFYGLGAGIPVTPWDWSFDLDDAAAAAMLAPCPEGAILVLHSPPQGHCDSTAAATTSAAGLCSGDRREAPPPRGLRPHPRVLGLREPGRRHAGPQPRPDRHLARDLDSKSRNFCYLFFMLQRRWSTPGADRPSVPTCWWSRPAPSKPN